MPNLKKKKKHERKQRGGLAVTRELGGGRIRGQPPWKRDGESRGSRGRHGARCFPGRGRAGPRPACGAGERGLRTRRPHACPPGVGGGGRPPSSPCAKRPHASHQHHVPAHTQGYQTFSGPSSTFHGKPVHSGQGARGKSSDRAAARGRARRAVNASETQRRPAGHGRSRQLKRRSDQGRSGSPDPGRIRRGLHARLRGGASALGC